MVNAGLKSFVAVLLLGAVVLTGVAALRGAEYDEQYTMFLTAGVARPVWPAAPFAAGAVQALQAPRGSLAGIARDLRATDVHPPLYFWSVALWRRFWGGGLFVARLWSVLCACIALAAVGVIARRIAVPVAPAMLLTLGCYGFAYTGAVARGFALAQALTLWGVAMLPNTRRATPCRHAAMAGVLLGAATFANYLAVFAAAAAVAAGVRQDVAGDREAGQRWREAILPSALAALAMCPFLLADFWFFVAQRNSRPGQFPPFHLPAAAAHLARYAAANLFGGLPLYAPPMLRPAVTAAMAALSLGCVGLAAIRWRWIARTAADRRLLLAAVVAPPAGLVLLGLAFDNTPIELRYLAFATPFAGLLLAGALGSLPARWRRIGTVLLSSVQAAALAGLMLRPETMQPAREAAGAAARLAEGGLILLPHGNDGVGVVGAFALESPPRQRLLVVTASEPPAEIAARIGSARRVVLARVAQDAASRATLPAMEAAVAGPCWRAAGQAFDAAAFVRICNSADPAPGQPRVAPLGDAPALTNLRP